MVDHPGTQLLGREPPGSSGVHAANRLVGQERVKPAELIAFEKQVGSLGETRSFGGSVFGVAGMATQLPRAQIRDQDSLFGHVAEASRIASDVQVALPAEMERVVALPGHLLQQIDRSVHQADHRRIRPPVPVTLGRLVGREGQRRSGIDQNDLPHSGLHGQVVGGGDAGDAGPDHDDVGVARHPAIVRGVRPPDAPWRPASRRGPGPGTPSRERPGRLPPPRPRPRSRRPRRLRRSARGRTRDWTR